MPLSEEGHEIDAPSGEVLLDRIVNVRAIRELIEDFHSLTGYAVSLVDLEDRFTAQVGWHDACLKFHRANPESAELCRQSDTDMVSDIADGEIRAYRCKNGLWHVATPLLTRPLDLDFGPEIERHDDLAPKKLVTGPLVSQPGAVEEIDERREHFVAEPVTQFHAGRPLRFHEAASVHDLY